MILDNEVKIKVSSKILHKLKIIGIEEVIESFNSINK
jgi:hypothetical protein